MRKWFLLILIIVIIGAVSAVVLFRKPPLDTTNTNSVPVSYYNELRRSCTDECCRSSVEDMEQGSWKLESSSGCPKGYESMGLRCPTSKRWCEKVGGSSQKEEKDAFQYQWSTSSQGPYRDRVSYATSTDLLTWTDSGKVLAEHASVPGAIVRNGEILVYFVDVSEDGKAEQLAVLRSGDVGRTWSAKRTITIEGVGDKVPVDPAPFVLDDGRIRLYYFDIAATRSPLAVVQKNRIYSAVSQDGVTFTEEEGVRFEKEGIFDPDVIKVGDNWRMYVGDPNGGGVFSATSTDGLTFEYEGIAYQGSAVPDVWFENGLYYLYTAGIDIAKSDDGQVFSATDKRFQSTLSPLTADPSVVKLPDGRFMMFYKTKAE